MLPVLISAPARATVWNSMSRGGRADGRARARVPEAAADRDRVRGGGKPRRSRSGSGSFHDGRRRPPEAAARGDRIRGRAGVGRARRAPTLASERKRQLAPSVRTASSRRTMAWSICSIAPARSPRLNRTPAHNCSRLASTRTAPACFARSRPRPNQSPLLLPVVGDERQVVVTAGLPREVPQRFERRECLSVVLARGRPLIEMELDDRQIVQCVRTVTRRTDLLEDPRGVLEIRFGDRVVRLSQRHAAKATKGAPSISRLPSARRAPARARTAVWRCRAAARL